MSADNSGKLALKDAVRRAREVAAKLTSSTNPVSGDDESPAKKPLLDNSGVDSKQIALQIAAGIAQRTGTGALGPMTVDTMTIPNRQVGVVIGKNGEMISKIQMESGTKVQVAPDTGSNGYSSERLITITGTAEGISKARQLITAVALEGRGGHGHGQGQDFSTAAPQSGECVMEVMIPTPKIGLIIGKGGEKIRRLQNEAGCQMIMVQDGPYQNSPEKPLRISGDPQKCQLGKTLVLDLINGPCSEFPPTNAYGSPDAGAQYEELSICRSVVGYVIGKGGDTLKKINNESGAFVQFKRPDPSDTPERVCMIQGNDEQVRRAKAMICEILAQKANAPPKPGMTSTPGVLQIEYTVPANKCGLVIGKGGENIRQIIASSGAFVEINKNIPEGASTKSFVIRGTEQQIIMAQQMIRDKAGDLALPLIIPSTIQHQQHQQQHQQQNHHQHQQMQQHQQQQPQPAQMQPQTWQMQQAANTMAVQAWPQAAVAPAGLAPTYAVPQAAAVTAAAATGMPAGASADYANAWTAYYQHYYQHFAAAQGQPQTAQVATVTPQQAIMQNQAQLGQQQPLIQQQQQQHQLLSQQNYAQAASAQPAAHHAQAAAAQQHQGYPTSALPPGMAYPQQQLPQVQPQQQPAMAAAYPGAPHPQQSTVQPQGYAPHPPQQTATPQQQQATAPHLPQQQQQQQQAQPSAQAATQPPINSAADYTAWANQYYQYYAQLAASQGQVQAKPQ